MKSKYACVWSSVLVPLCLLLALLLTSAGCAFIITKADEDFASVQGVIEAAPLQLDGEEVMLTEGQVECGVQAELWDITKFGPARSVGRLNQPARDLHFYDDVLIGEPGTHTPYAQLRGTFQIRLQDLTNLRDESPKYKLAEARIGVEIGHNCFASPLPQLMGVRRGRFTQDANPIVRIRVEGEKNWVFDRFQH